jgi:uncharacterized membrane protein
MDRHPLIFLVPALLITFGLIFAVLTDKVQAFSIWFVETDPSEWKRTYTESRAYWRYLRMMGCAMVAFGLFVLANLLHLFGN